MDIKYIFPNSFVLKIVKFYKNLQENSDQTWYSKGLKGNVSCLQPFALLANWVKIITEESFLNLKWRILNQERSKMYLFFKQILSK